MFGLKKEKKPKVTKAIVLLRHGLPNFMNNFVLEVLVDETNVCVVFQDGKKVVEKTATLPISKITHIDFYQLREQGEDKSVQGAIIGGAIAGTKGAIVGATAGKKQIVTSFLEIYYNSNGMQNKILLSQPPHGGDAGIKLIKTVIELLLLKENREIEQHIEL